MTQQTGTFKSVKRINSGRSRIISDSQSVSLSVVKMTPVILLQFGIGNNPNDITSQIMTKLLIIAAQSNDTIQVQQLLEGGYLDFADEVVDEQDVCHKFYLLTPILFESSINTMHNRSSETQP